MPQPTVPEILAMQSGPELDKMVHVVALHRPGKAPLYSTTPAIAAELINQLPIGVARLSPQSVGFKPDRPFVAVTLEKNAKDGTYLSTTSVTAATLPLALCKMALLFAIAPKGGAQPAGGSFPRIGSALQPRQLEPMPKRAVPAPPPVPGVPPVTAV